jgi:hypothetical protein
VVGRDVVGRDVVGRALQRGVWLAGQVSLAHGGVRLSHRVLLRAAPCLS